MNSPDQDKAQAEVDQLLSRAETLLEIADSVPLEQRYVRARLQRISQRMEDYAKEVLSLRDRMDKAHEWAQQQSQRLRKLENDRSQNEAS